MSILIGADIVPTESNKTSFDFGNMQMMNVELLNLQSNSDCCISNLEFSLVDIDFPIEKCCPNLRSEVSTVIGLKSIAANFKFFEDEYSKFSKEMLIGYLLPFSGCNYSLTKRLLKRIFGFRILKSFVNNSISSKEQLFILAVLQCEAHYELLLNGLKIKK
jgi:hypothetical protein